MTSKLFSEQEHSKTFPGGNSVATILNLYIGISLGVWIRGRGSAADRTFCKAGVSLKSSESESVADFRRSNTEWA